MKKRRRWIACGAVLGMLCNIMMPYGQQLALAKEKQEERLRQELLSYQEQYPEGGFAFYKKSETTLKEDGDRKKLLLVRLGDASKEATVDLKFVDITAKYGEDYEIMVCQEDEPDLTLVPSKKTKTAAEQAINDTDENTGVPKEKKSEKKKAQEKKSPLQKNVEKQTGKEANTTNWREELKDYAAKKASLEAENQLINSVEGTVTTLHFAPGEYKKEVYIHAIDDDIAECEENATLLLGNASVGLIGTRGQHNITIKDNEATEKITFAMKSPEIQVAKSATEAKITIQRTSGFGYYAAASYQTVSGTAEANVDYEPEDSGKISFTPGEKEKTVSISLNKGIKEGTYFSVVLDAGTVNVKKGKERVRVWIGKKKKNPVSNTKSLNLFHAARNVTGKASSNGIVYDTLTVSDPELQAYTHAKSDLDTSDYESANYSTYSTEATKVKYKTVLNGSSYNWFVVKIYYYDKNGTLWLGNNEKIYHETEKETEEYEDMCNISYSEGKDGTVKIRANTDGLCRTSEYTLKSATYYYPRYTLQLKDAKQTLKGKNYTSKNKSTEYDVPALESEPSWQEQTVKHGESVSLSPGSLTLGVIVDSYDLYVGDKYIMNSKGSSIDYSTLNKLRSYDESRLKDNQYTVTVKPKYKALEASVRFESQDSSCLSYSGDIGEEGFKVSDQLSCTQIDKVTFTATCPTDQKIKVSSVKKDQKVQYPSLFFGVDVTDCFKKEYKPETEAEELRFTKTTDIDGKEQTITAYYKEPTFTVQYEPTEMAAANKDAGFVTIADFKKPDNILGTSTYGEPYVRTQEISMLSSQYLFNVVLGEGFKKFTASDGNGNLLPFSTKTKWTYPDQTNPNRTQTVIGNSFIYSPYYADSTVTYYYSAMQDDMTQVGVDGKVYTCEAPLFSGDANKVIKVPAVGVNVNIGGYQTTTGSDGSYHIDANFNKGEYVGAFLSYNSLTMIDNVALSKNSTKDFVIDVNASEKLKITNSSMKHYVTTKERDMNNNKIVVEEEADGITLEDNKYKLSVQAQGSAGVAPAKAKFQFYDKKGKIKNDLTQEIAFNGDTAEFELNPMSVGGADGKSLAVGDGMTVTLIDTKGNSYFEHQTGIVVAEKLKGMYTYNYAGIKKEDDNAFVKALGGISVGVDFLLDALASDAGTYRDEKGMHHLMCIGFGNGFSSPEEIYKKEQETIKQLEEANSVGITPKKNDSFSFTGSGSWGLDIQLGVIMDTVLEETNTEKKGQYKFSDYVLIGTVIAEYRKEWQVPVGPLKLTFLLDFKTGDKQDGDATGIKWHFYNNSSKPFYVKENDMIDLLASKYIESQGDIEIAARIEGRVNAVAGGVVGVGGGVAAEFENHFAHQTNKGWTNSGAIILTPTIRLIVGPVKIPVWTQDWRYDYNNDYAKQSTQIKGLEQAFDEADILMTATDKKELNDYSYMDNQRWLGTKTKSEIYRNKTAAVEQLTEKVLAEGFYDESKMKLQSLGEGKYLAVFLNGVPDRRDEDKIGAYYSLFDGSQWSRPVLLEDDGTADELPVICNSGSKGYLVVWSDASGPMNMEKPMAENLNLYDLTGCFFDKQNLTMGNPMTITKTTAEDKTSDTEPKVAYYKDDKGIESLRLYYNKSEYSISNEADGEVVGDLLNPYQVVAVRTFDFTKDNWSEEFPDNIKGSMSDAEYEKYKENWYGQEFLDLAPSIQLTEELDEDGYWKEGTQMQVKELTDSQAIAKNGDVIAYNNLNLFAYALDKGGMSQDTDDQNLYLQLYDNKQKKYYYPVQITSKDGDISNIQFVRSAIPDGKGGKGEVTYLYWLENGVVKRINVACLVNCVKEGTTTNNKKYYYVDKTKVENNTTTSYQPEEVVAKSKTEVREGDVKGNEATMQNSITSFKVKQQGDYNYIVWNQLVPSADKNNQKIESHLYAVRENVMTGDKTLAVQLTDKEDLYIGKFNFCVTQDGNLDIIAGQRMLDDNGEPDSTKSQLVMYHIVPAQKVEISQVSESDVVTMDGEKRGISISTDVSNHSLQREQGLVAEVKDKEGNILYRSDEKQTNYDMEEVKNDDGSISITEKGTKKASLGTISLRGGETQSIHVIVPLDDTYGYEGTLILRKGDTILDQKKLKGTAKAVLSSSELSAYIVQRNKIKLSATVTNQSLINSKPCKATFGYKKEDGTKVALGHVDLPALSTFESTNVQCDAEVDFNQFPSRENPDGSLTASMNFYMDADTKDFVSVYATKELTADANQMSLMKSLTNVSAKCALTNTNAKVEETKQLEIGDSAKLEVTVNGQFAQNTKDYVNGLKVVWNRTKNNVVDLKKNGDITALGAGTTKVSGYIVPADNESILTNGAGAVSIDNYSRMPSAAIVPVQTTISVKKKGSSVAKPTTKPTPKKGDVFNDKKSKCKWKITKQSKTKHEISLVKYNGKSKKSFTIPNSITKNGIRYTVSGISSKAFYKNTKLTKVVIPKNVTRIDGKAFYGCKKLKTIKIISSKLQKIGSKVWSGIHKKAVIRVPKKKLKKYKKLLNTKTGVRKSMRIIKS